MTILYTIGHSTHKLSAFLAILSAHQITHIVDVRSIPKSRHVPWFNQSRFKAALQRVKISYSHLSKLGGLRRPTKESINLAWHNASFRGFADYMQTPDFYSGLRELHQAIKTKRRVAIMCAESLPWRCHRSLIADAELIRRIKVMHIMSATQIRLHRLTVFAVVDRRKRPIKIYYPG